MNRIKNYDELVAERRRLKSIIDDRRQLIHERIEGFMDKITPVLSVFSALNLFKKKDSNNSLLKMGSSLAIDFFIGQKLLKGANWFVKLLVPPLIRAVSSKVIERV